MRTWLREFEKARRVREERPEAGSAEERSTEGRLVSSKKAHKLRVGRARSSEEHAATSA
jgi:hypothetical protein